MIETSSPPVREVVSLFETPSGMIVLSDVSAVQCYTLHGKGAHLGPDVQICRVFLKCGNTFDVDIKFSGALIQALRAHHGGDLDAPSSIPARSAP